MSKNYVVGNKVFTGFECYLYGKRHNLEDKVQTLQRKICFKIVIESDLCREEYSLDDKCYSHSGEYNSEIMSFTYNIT